MMRPDAKVEKVYDSVAPDPSDRVVTALHSLKNVKATDLLR